MKKLSKVEEIKLQSRQLRGGIQETLQSESTFFNDQDIQLTKFHGIYQQDNRDSRKERRAAGLGKEYSMMIRCNIPAGILTGDQYLALDAIIDQFTSGSMRVTTRQSIQFHGVIKSNLREVIQKINDQLLTTMAACGDVQRNVMASIAPVEKSPYKEVRSLAYQLTKRLMPKTRAYHEIWLDGEKVESNAPERKDDFYGDSFLPRKFKTGITVAGENGIDVYSYDAGLIAVPSPDGELLGFNVVAGGGLGMSHGRANTFAQLAHEIGFVKPDHAIEIIAAIGMIYRDFGNREDRKQARLKYLINDKGFDWFVEELRSRIDFELFETRKVDQKIQYDDYLGPRELGDGKYSYGIFVQSGRIDDKENIRQTIKTIIKNTGADVVLTPQQSLLLTNITADDVSTIENLLNENKISLQKGLSNIQRYSMACPAMPTCGLALAESERVVVSIIRDLEELQKEVGISDAPISFRITGCPNGCARPYTADIALVGRRPGIYHLYVGGRIAGDRLADLYAADVSVEQSLEVLRPLFQSWAKDRVDDESIGDFYQRIKGSGNQRRRLTGKEEPTMPLVQLAISK